MLCSIVREANEQQSKAQPGGRAEGAQAPP